MDSNKVLTALKQTDDTQSIAKVAGQVVVDENMLRQIGGGRAGFSSGYFCTVSGECWGFSCNPFAR